MQRHVEATRASVLFHPAAHSLQNYRLLCINPSHVDLLPYAASSRRPPVPVQQNTAPLPPILTSPKRPGSCWSLHLLDPEWSCATPSIVRISKDHAAGRCHSLFSKMPSMDPCIHCHPTGHTADYQRSNHPSWLVPGSTRSYRSHRIYIPRLQATRAMHSTTWNVRYPESARSGRSHAARHTRSSSSAHIVEPTG